MRKHGAFINTRFSTDRQNETSTEDQVAICTQWCRQHGMPVLGIFSDEAVSGMKDTRPRYIEMLQQLRQGMADTVIIYDQSRMFRKLTAWFAFRDELERMGVTVISATQPLVGKDLRDPANFMFEGTTALFNQMWVLQTRQRVIVSMRNMAKSGKHTGGKAPLGYEVREGKLTVCEREAGIVRRIFSEYASGRTYREIITGLNRDGLTTKNGNSFGTNSLHDLLKNEKYIGTLVYGKTQKRTDGSRNSHGKAPADVIRIENAIPAIIDTELWEKVQKKMKANKHDASGRPAKVRQYPLKGKVFCGECGAALTGTTSQYRYHYYVCTGKQRLRNCDLMPTKMAELEQSVADAVRQVLGDPGNVHRLIETLRKSSEQLEGQAMEQLRRLTEKQREIDRQLEQAIDAVLNGLNSQALANRIQSLENEKARLDADIAAAAKAVDAAAIPEAALQQLFEVAVATDDTAVLLGMVTRVEVFHDTIKVWTILDEDYDKTDYSDTVFDESTMIPAFGITFSTPEDPLIKTVGLRSPAPKMRHPTGCLIFGAGQSVKKAANRQNAD